MMGGSKFFSICKITGVLIKEVELEFKQRNVLTEPKKRKTKEKERENGREGQTEKE